ncbi:hypothetical protein [Streptomyces sp. 3N207]|uniref:hypothetical protein n=1 Tax=Streptomyces sp. 3N207 TaxID=3457417 RepID=UPI003FD404E0
MSSYGAFEAYPRELQPFIDEMDKHGEKPDEINGDFKAEQALHEGWDGYSDKFYDTVHPDYVQANEQISALLETMREVTKAAASATMQSLRSIEGAQQDAEDMISQQSGSMNLDDLDDLDAGDAGSSGGKR